MAAESSADTDDNENHPQDDGCPDCDIVFPLLEAATLCKKCRRVKDLDRGNTEYEEIMVRGGLNIFWCLITQLLFSPILSASCVVRAAATCPRQKMARRYAHLAAALNIWIGIPQMAPTKTTRHRLLALNGVEVRPHPAS